MVSGTDQGVDQHLHLGVSPCTTGIIGTPALPYSPCLVRAKAQEMGWGPVEDDGEQVAPGRSGPVTAAHHHGGKAPAAPPMTMFCGREPLEPRGINDDVEQITANASQALSGLTKCQTRRRLAPPGRQPQAAPPMADRPEGTGGVRVRDMIWSMSRSNHMFTALAPPAIRYPPSQHPQTSDRLGQPRRRDEHRDHGSDQQQRNNPWLGQADEIPSQ